MATKEKSKGVPIEDTIKEIRKKFGQDAIMLLSETPRVDVEVLSTGSIGVDMALGIGGLPRGRIVELYGPESSGKTTLALHVVAEAQKRGWECAFVDAEHSMDPQYAQKLGVDVSKLLIAQPSCGEEGLQIVDALVRGGKTGVVVVDSVAALTPKAIIEGEIGEIKVGALARLMSVSLSMLKGSIAKSNTIVIFINQLRMNIAAAASWGAPPETTTGGKALKFYADLRIEVRRTETIKKGEDPIGARTRVKIVKNKVAPPFKVAIIDVLYNHGISKESELLMLGEKHGVIEKSGSGYAWGELKLGRGYESARQFLVDNTAVAAELRQEVIAKAQADI